MSQMSFSDFEYADKRKQTRRKLVLAEMNQVVPWNGLLKLVEPHCPKADSGRKPYPMEPCCEFICCRTGLPPSDPAMEEALYEITPMHNMRGALEVTDKNEELINMTLAVMMTVEILQFVDSTFAHRAT